MHAYHGRNTNPPHPPVPYPRATNHTHLDAHADHVQAACSEDAVVVHVVVGVEEEGVAGDVLDRPLLVPELARDYLHAVPLVQRPLVAVHGGGVLTATGSPGHMG